MTPEEQIKALPPLDHSEYIAQMADAYERNMPMSEPTCKEHVERMRAIASTLASVQQEREPVADGAALRLMVDREMDVFIRAGRWTEAVCPMGLAVKEPHGTDPYGATRRAIEGAAAAVDARKEQM